MHESGHGLYENGVDPELDGSPLGRPRSLGLHESQSRMWENWVGRSRPYLAALLRAFASAFPEQFDDVDAEALYRAANKVERSLIRIEADELTYNLHILLRFELEREMFEGGLELARPAGGLERAHAPTTSGSRCPTTPTACSRTCTGPAARSATSRPTRSAT